ncbi:MAG: hypothetical protein H6510_16715 [Acidobacteria bacterium]|nr:hypothetical protein [Acidobacteriota bacterium]MCB9399458.1 hypothetical protein [Acidobacteriota bacterium]
MFLLFVLFFQESSRVTEVIPFLPPEKNQAFTMEIQQAQVERRFKVLAESLRKNFDLNLMIEDSANVEVLGNFTNVTVNEFLTYVLETYGLEWKKIGNIYHIYKPKPPEFELKVEVADNKISVQASNAPIQELVKVLSQKLGQNVLVDPNQNKKISGFILDMEWETGLNALLQPYDLLVEKKEGYFQVAAPPPPPSTENTQVPQPNYPKLTYQDNQFEGLLKANNFQQAIEALTRSVEKPFKLLDPLPNTSVELYIQGRDFPGAMTALFLGTPFSYKEVDGVILVGSKDRPELTATQIIPIRHMNAQNILAYITGEVGLFQTFNLPSRPSTFGAYSQNSTSRFRDGYQQQQFSEQSQIKPPTQVKQQLNVFGDVKVDLTLVREQNSIMITATQDIIDEVRARIEMIDLPVPQVLIEALVVDFKTDAKDELGVTITNGDNSYFPGLDISLEGNRGEDGNFRIGRLPSNFGLRVKALAEQGKARIISKPLVATLSGHEAYIEVGLTQAYKLTSESLVGDNTPRQQTYERIETIEANISLRVIPWVTADGEITSYIEPVFNSFLGQVEDNVPPPISTRRLQSTVRLRDGETIILGGLIEESLRRTDRGVPGLSRIPLLGHLFKNFNRDFTNAELVIYLTPHVYYGNEGSAVIIRHNEGMDYPLDVKKQQENLKKKKKRWWRKN